MIIARHSSRFSEYDRPLDVEVDPLLVRFAILAFVMVLRHGITYHGTGLLFNFTVVLSVKRQLADVVDNVIRVESRVTTVIDGYCEGMSGFAKSIQ